MGFLSKAAKRAGVVEAVERFFLPQTAPMQINGTVVEYTYTQLFAYLNHRPDDGEFWFESNVSRQFADWCKPGDTVLDIGADHGFYSLLAATEVGDTGIVIAFEAHPRAARATRQNLGQNSLEPTVQVEEVAVSDSVDEVTFGHNSITRGKADGISVQSTTLDQYTASGGVTPDFVKIDVEGAEAAVIRGAEDVLQSHQPKLFIEVHAEEKLQQFGGSQAVTYNRLAELGYQVWRYDAEDGQKKAVSQPPSPRDRHHIFARPTTD